MKLETPWRFALDVYNEGDRLNFHEPGLDDSEWKEVAVPGAFDGYGENMAFYQGPAWYRKSFKVSEDWRGQHVVLRFDGVNYRTRAFFNGELIGENHDPFLPFEFDLTEHLRYGERNTLSLQVDNTCHPEDLPGRHIGWRNVGGILREVKLIVMNPMHVGAVRIAAGSDGSLELKGDVEGCQGDVGNPLLKLTISDCRAETTDSVCVVKSLKLRTKSDGTVTFRTKLSIPEIKPWSPQSPSLYVAGLELQQDGKVVDKLETRFGFRTIETQGTKLLLNGEEIFLTGFNRHEDSPSTDYALDIETMKKDLSMMKEAGSNFIRLCHYPHDSSELDYCDKIGLLAKCEVPLYFWNPNARQEGKQYQTQRAEAAARQLRKLVARDRNHPSVIIWSVSNETHEEEKRVTADNKRLIRMVKKLDPSRLAVHVSNRWNGGGFFEEDDLICCNYYPSVWPGITGEGGNEDSPRAWAEALDKIHGRYPETPILVTEFGCMSADAQVTGRFSPGYYAKAIEAEFPVLANHEHVCGATIWCWADHLWPHADFMKSVAISPFGVLTRGRRPLAQFWAARRMYREKQRIQDPPPPASPSPSANRVSVNVTMIREHLDDIPQFGIPEGYAIRTMTADDAGIWGDIWHDADQARGISIENFVNDFGENLPALAWRGFILEAPTGQAAGTVAAWMNRTGQWKDYGRIHYLALRREFQGKGLAKILMSHALTAMKQWHDKAMLGTQSHRPGAIALYEKFGFTIVENTG